MIDEDEMRERHAQRCQHIIDTLRDRLGPEYFTKGEDVAFELTPRGRTMVRYDGVAFFLDEDLGEVVASRVRGGRAEFGTVTTDGRFVWPLLMPLTPAGVN